MIETPIRGTCACALRKCHKCPLFSLSVQVSRLEVQRAANYLRCGQILQMSAAAKKARWYNTFLILVLELKNTLGLSGDTLYQAVVDYRKFVSREKGRIICCSQYHRLPFFAVQVLPRVL